MIEDVKKEEVCNTRAYWLGSSEGFVCGNCGEIKTFQREEPTLLKQDKLVCPNCNYKNRQAPFY